MYPGTQETSLPQIFLGTYYVPCALKPSGAIEQFKLYPKETNKNPHNLLGKSVILGMEPKVWYMLAEPLPRFFETTS